MAIPRWWRQILFSRMKISEKMVAEMLHYFIQKERSNKFTKFWPSSLVANVSFDYNLPPFERSFQFKYLPFLNNDSYFLHKRSFSDFNTFIQTFPLGNTPIPVKYFCFLFVFQKTPFPFPLPPLRNPLRGLPFLILRGGWGSIWNSNFFRSPLKFPFISQPSPQIVLKNL